MRSAREQKNASREKEIHQRTISDEDLERDESLGSTSSDSSVRTLESGLEELDEVSKRDSSDSEIEEALIHPCESVRLSLWRFGLGQGFEGCWIQVEKMENRASGRSLGSSRVERKR